MEANEFLKWCGFRLEKLMMVSVTERYALAFQLGLEAKDVALLDLNGSPRSASIQLSKLVQHRGFGEARVEELLEEIRKHSLPVGIPD